MATILVVDDRAINREFLVTLLGYSGHDLIQGANGNEALEKIRLERPDLIITDILMPNMNGFELVQQLRADPVNAQIPVIFYTATYRLPHARELADACGVSLVIPKPSDPEIILDAVNKALGLSQPVSPQYPSGARPERESKQIKERLSEYMNELQEFNRQMNEVLERGLILASHHEQLSSVSEQLTITTSNLQAVSLRLATIIELGLDLASHRDSSKLFGGILPRHKKYSRSAI